MSDIFDTIADESFKDGLKRALKIIDDERKSIPTMYYKDYNLTRLQKGILNKVSQAIKKELAND